MFTPTNLTPAVPVRDRVRACLAALLTVISLAVVHGGAAAQSQAAYSQPELDRMLAPIALYPDPLLSQILMAATYPVEVVEAARWSRAHPSLLGDTAVRAVEDEDWDPSVKSLVAFPGVLARMDEDLEWTRQLGDAFLDQEAQVMETVQALRRRARAAGTLASDARIVVVDDGRTLAVRSADPSIIYVPYYDPRVAYGAWWWPAYPPVFWAPWPGYAVHYPPARSGVAGGFFWGPAVRISVGFFFGAIDWPRREVRVVSVTNYYYRPAIVRRSVRVHEHVVVTAPGRWHHDPWHRRGATYRTPEAQRRLAPAAPPREAHRPEQRRPATAVPRPELRTVRPDPPAQTAPSVPRRDKRAETRRDSQPRGDRTELRQPGSDAARAAPAARGEARRERAPSRPETATPPASTPRPAVTAEPNPREARRDDARDGGRQRERRTDARVPATREPAQRNADGERAQRGPRERPEAKIEPQRGPRERPETQSEPPRGPRGDDRSQERSSAGGRGQS